MFKFTLPILCILVNYASFSQCALSFQDLQSLAKENRQEFETRLANGAFSLEKDIEQNGLFQRHYFCMTNSNRMEARQLTAVGIDNLIKAVTYETSDSTQFKNICNDFKRSGYSLLKTVEDVMGDQRIQRRHYKKGNSEIAIYHYEMDGYRLYCCTLQQID